MEDVRALIDAVGAERVHLVGHDFGAAVVWQAALDMPQRLITATPLSLPHGTAWLKSFLRSRQALAPGTSTSFCCPVCPSICCSAGTATDLVCLRLLQCQGQTCEAAYRDARAMTEQGRLTCALNWYRAMLLADVRGWCQNIIRSVPTMYVWADQDSTIMGAGARACGDYVRSEYRFEILRGVSHWMLDDAPGAVSDLLLDWFAAHRSPQHSGG